MAKEKIKEVAKTTEKQQEIKPLTKFQRIINGRKVIVEAATIEEARILFDKLNK